MVVVVESVATAQGHAGKIEKPQNLANSPPKPGGGGPMFSSAEKRVQDSSSVRSSSNVLVGLVGLMLF